MNFKVSFDYRSTDDIAFFCVVHCSNGAIVFYGIEDDCILVSSILCSLSSLCHDDLLFINNYINNLRNKNDTS